MDEPVFVLRAQDELAPGLVEEWAARAEKRGTPADKVAQARSLAQSMAEWQREHGCKVPD